MKKTIILALSIIMLFAITSIAYASEPEPITLSATNVNEVITAASNGNESAIKALNSLSIFDKTKVDKAIKGVTFSSEEKPKTIDFGDGSSITISVSSKANTSAGTRSFEYLYSGSATYEWKFYGACIASYTIYADYWIDDGYDTVRLESHRDSSWSTFPYIAFNNGTRAIQTSGTRVRVRGEGGFQSNGGVAGSETKEFEFRGYANQTCTITVL